MGQKASERYHSPLSETVKSPFPKNFHEDPPCPLKPKLFDFENVGPGLLTILGGLKISKSNNFGLKA